jgi:hypothetical protein
VAKKEPRDTLRTLESTIMDKQESRNSLRTNGHNNGQMALGGTVIQFGTVNGGAVNLRSAGDEPFGYDAAVSLPAAEQEEILALRQVLDDRFGEEDLRDLVFDLAIDYDDLPGKVRKHKARELVVYCHRRGRLAELRSAILQRRPGVL